MENGRGKLREQILEGNLLGELLHRGIEGYELHSLGYVVQEMITTKELELQVLGGELGGWGLYVLRFEGIT